MIGHLRGTFFSRQDNLLIIDVNGVGYEVNVTDRSLAQLPKRGEQVALTIATIVRQESLDLYGFADQQERHLFYLFMGVSGIGPRQAIHLLSSATVDDIMHAIANMDSSFLESIRGIGKKTAQKIILELKDRVNKLIEVQPTSDEPPTSGQPAGLRYDLKLALDNLGYKSHQVDQVLAQLDLHEGARIEDVLRQALKVLSKQPGPSQHSSQRSSEL